MENDVLKAVDFIKKTFNPSQIKQLIRLLEPTSPAGEMSAEEFESVLEMLEENHTGRWYSNKSIEAARLVLVMGASISEAAADTEQSRQSVSQLMQRIKNRIDSIPDDINVPDDWVKVEQWLPPEVAVQFNNLSEELKASPEDRVAVYFELLSKDKAICKNVTASEETDEVSYQVEAVPLVELLPDGMQGYFAAGDILFDGGLGESGFDRCQKYWDEVVCPVTSSRNTKKQRRFKIVIVSVTPGTRVEVAKPRYTDSVLGLDVLES